MKPTLSAASERSAIGPLASELGSGAGTFSKGVTSQGVRPIATQPGEGLTSEEARKRLEQDGPNVLEAAEPVSFLSILVTQMKNVIFLLTLVAATITYAMGDDVKAYVLVCIVIFVCSINALGEWSGQDAGKALRDQMGKEEIRVTRDGCEVWVKTEEIVVGDLVTVSMGDMVPADMVVRHTVDLRMNEAVLTGEPTERLKTLKPKSENEAFPSNIMYSGTSVEAGEGRGEVVATGMKTQVGIIAKRLKVDEEPDINPLQKSINHLGKIIGICCVVIIAVATSVSFFTGYQNPITPCPDDDGLCLLMTSAARGLIMAVSIIPHGLPFVVMVMLRVGSQEMALRNAMVTRRTAVDYLGATSIICTDKTGTLTQGKMTAQALVGLCRHDGEEEAKHVVAECYPLCGLSPNGGFFEAAALSAHPQAKQSMDEIFDIKQTRQNFAQPGLPDLSSREEVGQVSLSAQMVQAHLAGGFLNCYATKLQKDQDDHWATLGNMTEAAVKVAAAKGGLWDSEGLGRTMLQETHQRAIDLEVPFTSGRKMMATVHALPEDGKLASMQFKSDASHCAILKGAPDRLLPRLQAVFTCGADNVLWLSGAKLSSEERTQLEEQNGSLASRALRSLLVAVCPLTALQVETLRGTPSADDRLEFLLAKTELCFLSLWGIFDPPRAAVPGSVRECQEAGIRVVMITGDQKPTAMAIGKQVGIIQDAMIPEMCASLCSELHGQTKPVHFDPSSHKDKVSQPTWEALEASASVKDGIAAFSGLVFGEAPQSSIPMKQAQSTAPVKRCETQMEAQTTTMSVLDPLKKAMQESVYRSQEELDELSDRCVVWARAQPTDKVTLVEALRHQGHITAMTGDGVNDAPALKKADAGVAMGISGTAVTKNASDLILMDDDFSTIVSAIREGRRIYSNTQKYVTFNLSVKAGECCCLMSAIFFGVPMPIRGLQLLLNLVCTHILPTLSLAWEKPEPYLMKVPPREIKGDLVVSKVMWLFRWLPFVICMPACVMCCLAVGVWANTGYVEANDLIGSSRITAIMHGRAACEFAGVLEEGTGRFLDDAMPFHCKCHSRGGNPFAAATAVEQWGRTGEEQELEAVFDPWTGSTGTIYDLEKTPWKAGTADLLTPCVDRRGVERWCWRDEVPPAEGRPWLPVGQNCAAYGAQLGQSGAYVVIHLGEILTLLTFRTDAFFLPHTFTNPIYTGFLIFNLTCLFLFLYTPFISSTLGLAPLTAVRMSISVFFALTLVALNELVKIGYRKQMKEHNDKMAPVALRRSLGGAPTYDARGNEP